MTEYTVTLREVIIADYKVKIEAGNRREAINKAHDAFSFDSIVLDPPEITMINFEKKVLFIRIEPDPEEDVS